MSAADSPSLGAARAAEVAPAELERELASGAPVAVDVREAADFDVPRREVRGLANVEDGDRRAAELPLELGWRQLAGARGAGRGAVGRAHVGG